MTASATSSLALTGATVYADPDNRPLADGVVVVRGGEIAEVGRRGSVPIPPDARVLDCAGLSVAPGFWNCHVHFFERKWSPASEIPRAELERELQETFLRYGVTSVFDLSSSRENTRALAARIGSGEIAGPRIRSTGEGLIPRGGAPSEAVVSLMGLAPAPLPEVETAAEAAAAARTLLDAGVDGIKLFASGPRGPALAETTLRAAVEEAHRSGKPAFVHPNTKEDVAAALRAGADVIAHTTPRSGPWDERLLAMVREKGAALTPTLGLWRHFLRHDRARLREETEYAAAEQLRSWIAAGGEVLFGTDLGAVAADPGPEYAAMAEAGMDLRRILASLTSAPAARFGACERLGRIVPGYAADLCVLGGDPSADPTALADVRLTLVGGRVVFASS